MKSKCYQWLIALMLVCTNTTLATELTHWPADIATQLNQLIQSNAHQQKFAVFDMDNTSYDNDLSESLLAFMEIKGWLTRDKLPDALKLIPFKDTKQTKESLYSYYQRLCQINALICYPWIAQAFSGFTLAQLKSHVDQLMGYQQGIPVTYFEKNQLIHSQVYPPHIYRGMIELYNKLQENGIDVYVITAANEELVRMVASDAKYGYHVKPENIFGINLLLKHQQTGAVTTSHLQMQQGSYDPKKNQQLVLTPYLINPMTWCEGKAGTIIGWIDQWKKPILVAGDTPSSDGYMLLNSTDVAQGGHRLWINHSTEKMQAIRTLWQKSATEQKKLGLPVTADKNWLVVTPKQIQ